MARTFPSALVAEKNKVTTTSPWVWLVELQRDATTALRLAAHDTQITFEGETWYPYPVSIAPIRQQTGGDVDGVRLSVSNVGRIAMSFLEADEVIGKTVRLILANTTDLSSSGLQEKFRVRAATATETEVSLDLGQINPLGVGFPAEVAWRTRCRFLKEYGSGRCGYDTTLPNLISGTRPDFDPASCDGSLDGSNGCKVHGENEAANAAAQLHPARYGGFPGIPEGTIVG